MMWCGGSLDATKGEEEQETVHVKKVHSPTSTKASSGERAELLKQHKKEGLALLIDFDGFFACCGNGQDVTADRDDNTLRDDSSHHAPRDVVSEDEDADSLSHGSSTKRAKNRFDAGGRKKYSSTIQGNKKNQDIFVHTHSSSVVQAAGSEGKEAGRKSEQDKLGLADLNSEKGEFDIYLFMFRICCIYS
jgi:hypothetical protein